MWESTEIPIEVAGSEASIKDLVNHTVNHLQFQGLYEFCSTKFRKKNIRDILYQPLLPRLINRDSFIAPPYSLDPYMNNRRSQTIKKL